MFIPSVCTMTLGYCCCHVLDVPQLWKILSPSYPTWKPNFSLGPYSNTTLACLFTPSWIIFPTTTYCGVFSLYLPSSYTQQPPGNPKSPNWTQYFTLKLLFPFLFYILLLSFFFSFHHQLSHTIAMTLKSDRSGVKSWFCLC